MPVPTVGENFLYDEIYGRHIINHDIGMSYVDNIVNMLDVNKIEEKFINNYKTELITNWDYCTTYKTNDVYLVIKYYYLCIAYNIRKRVKFSKDFTWRIITWYNEILSSDDFMNMFYTTIGEDVNRIELFKTILRSEMTLYKIDMCEHIEIEIQRKKQTKSPYNSDDDIINIDL